MAVVEAFEAQFNKFWPKDLARVHPYIVLVEEQYLLGQIRIFVLKIRVIGTVNWHYNRY